MDAGATLACARVRWAQSDMHGDGPSGRPVEGTDAAKLVAQSEFEIIAATRVGAAGWTRSIHRSMYSPLLNDL